MTSHLTRTERAAARGALARGRVCPQLSVAPCVDVACGIGMVVVDASRRSFELSVVAGPVSHRAGAANFQFAAAF
jgi:hypothetical protein